MFMPLRIRWDFCSAQAVQLGLECCFTHHGEVMQSTTITDLEGLECAEAGDASGLLSETTQRLLAAPATRDTCACRPTGIGEWLALRRTQCVAPDGTCGHRASIHDVHVKMTSA